MRLTNASSAVFDFSYCMNVHPGESLASLHAALEQRVPPIHQALAGDQPFGLGLRIADEASRELLEPGKLAALRSQLDAGTRYAFTINGFPFGQFHQGVVKEKVYAPDWRTETRVQYTCRLMDILAHLLPERSEGSISTVPVSFKPWAIDRQEQQQVIKHLAATVAHAGRIEQERGVCLHVGLEPEPACFLETTEETISFFENGMLGEGLIHLQKLAGIDASAAEMWMRRHLGVCLDTCHSALQFESPADNLTAYARAGMRVSKLQLSAALELDGGQVSSEVLNPFLDEVYLHQVIARTKEGELIRWTDLPDFLAASPGDLDTVRIHFHVPLHWEGGDALRSTAHTMDDAFWNAVSQSECRHLEVETYTFDVLPKGVGQGNVEQDMVHECRWALAGLNKAGFSVQP